MSKTKNTENKREKKNKSWLFSRCFKFKGFSIKSGKMPPNIEKMGFTLKIIETI